MFYTSPKFYKHDFFVWTVNRESSIVLSLKVFTLIYLCYRNMPLDEAISFISRRYSTFIEKGENKDKPIAEAEKKDEIRNVDTLIKHVLKKNVM